jgi:mono/diheme cytochrome c family protein
MPRTVLVAVILAAAPPASAQTLTPRERGDLAVRARRILLDRCGDCHGERPKRGDVSLLDYAKIAGEGFPLPLLDVSKGKDARSLILELIADGSMPPGGRPGPTAGEIKVLAAWVAAGAPEYPKAFGDPSAMDAARKDWTAQFRADQPNVRYLSFAHLVRDDAPLPDLAVWERKLRVAVEGATGTPAKLPAADEAATVFRLDLKAAGLLAGNLFDRVETGGPRENAHRLTPFDVALLDYPHRAPPADPAAEKMLAALAGVRKTPVVRGDWFADALAPGTPLAADLRALADLGRGAADGGPRPVRFFAAKADADRPLEAWHTGDPDAAAFRFTAEVVAGEKFDTPTPAVAEEGRYKLRVTTDRRVTVRVVGVLSDGTTRMQKLERDTLDAGTHTIGPAANKGFSSGSLVRGLRAETEYYVVFAAEAPIPDPTILRSRHHRRDDLDRYPVWRFVFEPPPEAKFDPARVVRCVVPLEVRKRDAKN